MAFQWVKAGYCLLWLWLLTTSAAAQQNSTTESPAAALEQQLDQYVLQSYKDAKAAEVLLTQLEPMLQQQDLPVASRVRLLSYLTSQAFYQQNEELVKQHLAELEQLAGTIADADVLSEIYATRLEILFYQKQLNQAIMQADRLQILLMDAGKPRIRYYANNVLARLFKADSQYSLALQHFIAALDAVMETDDAFTLRRRSFLHYNMAQVQTELRNWPQARELTEQLINDAKKYQHQNFLPDLYLLLGYIEGSAGNQTDAIRINKLGLEVSLNLGDESYALTFENNLGSSYIETEQYAAAKPILQTALERAQRLKDEYSEQLINMNLGFIRVKAGEHDAGIAQMQRSMRYFSENAAKIDYEPYYEWLAKAFAEAGRYKEQAETLLEQMALQKQLRAADRESRLSELQSRFDTKAKTQQITILQQENDLKAQMLENQQLQQRLIILIVALSIFAMISVFQLYRKVRRSNRRLYETNQQLAYQSQRDPLTGLYNRRALQQHMQRRSKKAGHDMPVRSSGILLLDIDFFKRINDNFGHNAGDAVLVEISQRLQHTVREQDLVVRWGGEEILLLLEHIEPHQVAGFVSRILQVITEQPVSFEQQQIPVSASGGFIHLPFAGLSEVQLGWEKAMQIVDMALYLSKTNGRNQVCLINGLKADFSEVEMLLTSDLAGAIRQNMVEVATVSGPAGPVS